MMKNQRTDYVTGLLKETNELFVAGGKNEKDKLQDGKSDSIVWDISEWNRMNFDLQNME